MANYKKPENLISETGLLKQLTKALVERAIEAEIADRISRDKNEPVNNQTGNTRNGKNRKRLKADFGELPIQNQQGVYQTRPAKYQSFFVDAKRDAFLQLDEMLRK